MKRGIQMSMTDRICSTQLAEAIEDADMRVLLMVLVHLTGDLKWLDEPFKPVRDVKLIPDPSAGLPPDVCTHIKRAALEAIDSAQPPAIVDPGDELMQKMM